MFVKFITSRLLRVIVCAAAGLYGLYNAISCFVTLYKAVLVWLFLKGTKKLREKTAVR